MMKHRTLSRCLLFSCNFNLNNLTGGIVALSFEDDFFTPLLFAGWEIAGAKNASPVKSDSWTKSKSAYTGADAKLNIKNECINLSLKANFLYII